MADNSKTASLEQEMIQIQGNSDVDYWAKKYGISTEELKKEGNNIGVSDKIINAHIRNKNLSN